MRHVCALVLTGMLAVGFGGSLSAQDSEVASGRASYRVGDIPRISDRNSFVFDPDGVLGPYAAQVDATLKRLDDETDAQGMVVVLPGIGDEVPKDFAVELFERLEIGNRGTDFGYLLLLVLDQRRAEIETGYGLERYVTDLLAKRLLEREFVPRMRAGAPGEAVYALTQALEEVTRNGLAGEPSRYQRELDRDNEFRWPPALLFYLFCCLVFHVVLAFYLYAVYRNKNSLYDKWYDVEDARMVAFCIVFPLPYLLVYAWLGRWKERLRLTPRFDEATGAPMRLLSDYDEIDHLLAGQLAEQEVDSAQWDVWATEDLAHVKVLRYETKYTPYRKCPVCRYVTYKKTKSRTLKPATYSQSGLREVTKRCAACDYTLVSTEVIPQRSESSSSGGGSYGGGGGGSSYSGGGGGGSSGGGGAGASW